MNTTTFYFLKLKTDMSNSKKIVHSFEFFGTASLENS